MTGILEMAAVALVVDIVILGAVAFVLLRTVRKLGRGMLPAVLIPRPGSGSAAKPSSPGVPPAGAGLPWNRNNVS